MLELINETLILSLRFLSNLLLFLSIVLPSFLSTSFPPFLSKFPSKYSIFNPKPLGSLRMPISAHYEP